MQLFVRTLTGETVTIDCTSASTVEYIKAVLAEKTGVDAEEQRLLFAAKPLDDETTVEECGLIEESTIDMLAVLDGGKRKRKKKVYTKPKRIPHKHRKNPLGTLKCYKVTASGTVERTRKICPNAQCLDGIFMGVHQNRYYCGKCYVTYKFDKDGN